MANEMPPSSSYSGLSRVVLAYSEAFRELVDKAKSGTLSDADWLPIERLVDVDAFQRLGVFLTATAELVGWQRYKALISQYAAGTSWEGTLRNITEAPGRVILELEERNTRDGVTDVANTVTIYEFGAADKLQHLEVYVMRL